MEQGYKHFSHSHNLVMHQLPEGVEVSCSGCNSSGTGTLYACWHCNFFLHEQCYGATRSLKHPSHPPHPLTLVPFPTYPSNSFFCNSCEIIGTGFSYSCADCEFDLHIQCAYSISGAAGFQKAHHYHELVPPAGWNGVQNSNMAHNVPFLSVPNSHSIAFNAGQRPYLPPSSISDVQFHSTIHDLAYASIPPGRQNSIPTSQDPPMVHNIDSGSMSSQGLYPAVQVPSMSHNGPSVPIPTNPPNRFPSAQEPSLMPQNGPSVSDPMKSHNTIANGQYSSLTHNLTSVSVANSSQGLYPAVEVPSMAQNGPSVSIPTNPSNPFPIAQDPSLMPQNGLSVSDPMKSQNTLANGQYSSMPQTGPSVSVPTNPPNSFPSAQDPSLMPQSRPSVSDPMISQNTIANGQYFSTPQTGPSVSVPTNPPNSFPRAQDPSLMPQNEHSVSDPMKSQNPIANGQYSSMPHTGPSVSVSANPPSPITSKQDPSMPQNGPFVSDPMKSQNTNANGQNSSLPQTGPSVSVATNSPNPITSKQDPSMPQNTPASFPTESGQNQLKNKGVMHFSHPHNLSIVNLKDDEENEVTCSGCEEILVGKGYSCVEPNCSFHLHESCFNLKKDIHHKSHPEHPLTLLPMVLYNNNGEYTCNACFSDGTGFTYHCSICGFDLHIQCVNLPETVKRDDHNHVLKLYYSTPVKEEEYTFYCDICHGAIERDRWVYNCESCDFGTHLGCVDCEECEADSPLDVQVRLQRLQLQMEMARQQAQLIASIGSSMSSLIS